MGVEGVWGMNKPHFSYQNERTRVDSVFTTSTASKTKERLRKQMFIVMIVLCACLSLSGYN